MESIEELLGKWLLGFEGSTEFRLLMRCARRAGIPMSEARRRWIDPDDLAAEIAFDAFEAREAAAACGRCGVDPRDQINFDIKRPHDFPKWRADAYYCPICDDLARLEAKMAKSNEKSPDRGGWQLRVIPNDGDEGPELDIG